MDWDDTASVDGVISGKLSNRSDWSPFKVAKQYVRPLIQNPLSYKTTMSDHLLKILMLSFNVNEIRQPSIIITDVNTSHTNSHMQLTLT